MSSKKNISFNTSNSKSKHGNIITNTINNLTTNNNLESKTVKKIINNTNIEQIKSSQFELEMKDNLKEKENHPNLSLISSTPKYGNQNTGKVKVMCRFRPISEKEREYSKNLCTEYMDSSQVTIKTTNDLNTYRFSFDKIFGPKSNQQEVFEYSAKPIIDSVLNGYNGTIFAYGQTSSGKTYTMMGDLRNDENEGIIPKMVKHVFSYISNSTSETEYIVKLSMMEIYLEKISDLIETNRINLNIREDKNKGIFVEDLSEHYVASEEEVIDLIQIGLDNRKIGNTIMNDYSSRSHTVLMLTIKSTCVSDLSTKTGTLFLVDLAGSEKVSKTGAKGVTLEEAKMINSSLTTLGMVINSLTDEKSTHIPYRESKITRILQESLGGNAMTCLIITCSPSTYNESETLSTLRFGMRAKKIENKPKINKEISASELKQEIDRLESYLNEAEVRISQLEKYILLNGLQVPKKADKVSKEVREYKEMRDYKEKMSYINSGFFCENTQNLNSYVNNNMKNSIVNSNLNSNNNLIELDTSMNLYDKNNTNRKTNSSMSQPHSNINLSKLSKSRYSELIEDNSTNTNNINGNKIFSDNIKYLNLVSENKSLMKKLRESEDLLTRSFTEAIERENYIKSILEKTYSLEELRNQNIQKIEYLERKIKQIKFEESKENSYVYNSTDEPLKFKLIEIVDLISENAPSFKLSEKRFIRETINLISKIKNHHNGKYNDDEELFYISKNSVPEISEIEEKFEEKLKNLTLEKDELHLADKEKGLQLCYYEKLLLKFKEKIDYLETYNSLNLEEKNLMNKIESLEVSLEKLSAIYHQLNIQKSALVIENEVKSKIIKKKNEIIENFEKNDLKDRSTSNNEVKKENKNETLVSILYNHRRI